MYTHVSLYNDISNTNDSALWGIKPVRHVTKNKTHNVLDKHTVIITQNDD